MEEIWYIYGPDPYDRNFRIHVRAATYTICDGFHNAIKDSDVGKCIDHCIDSCSSSYRWCKTYQCDRIYDRTIHGNGISDRAQL